MKTRIWKKWHALNERVRQIEVSISQQMELDLSQKIEQYRITTENTIDSISAGLVKMESEFRICSDQVLETKERIERLYVLEPSFFDTQMLEKKIYSQAGEDSIIIFVLNRLGIPFSECNYLDLGANHAKELSNTYFFYSQGAKGVLVEAIPKLIPELRFYRHRDIVLNNCVDVQSGRSMEFYVFNVDGLSTPNRDDIEGLLAKNSILRLEETVVVSTITVNEILEKYFEKAPVLMSIDLEGKDFEILQSIDLVKWRPLIIIIEVIPYYEHLVVEEKEQKVVDFMLQNDYIEYAFTGINSIFIDRRQVPKNFVQGCEK